ncbi:MAG TPA: DnaB-like helicase C-terminal domain-containing protein [Gemmatimonadaceae bacterium]
MSPRHKAGEEAERPASEDTDHPGESKRPVPTEGETLVPVALAGEAAGPPITSGFPSLDSLLGGGLRRGDLVILAGDAGVGKSALALAMALRAAGAGQTAAYLTGEMSTARVMERALAIEGRVRVDDLRRGLDEVAHSGVAAAAITLRRRTPLFEDLRDAGIDGVSDFLAHHLGIDLTIVDPVQALTRGIMPVEEEVADIARRLKELALRRSTVIVATSWLRESAVGRVETRPTLRDLGGVGALRHHADVVLGLYREELYQPSPHVEGATELAVLKNRSGPTGLVDLYFYKQWLRFEDMVEPRK